MLLEFLGLVTGDLFVDLFQNKMTDHDEETNNNNNKMLIEAISARMEQMLNANIDALHLEFQQNSNREQQRQQRQTRDEALDYYYRHNSSSSQGSQRKHRRTRKSSNTILEFSNLEFLHFMEKTIQMLTWSGKKDRTGF